MFKAGEVSLFTTIHSSNARFFCTLITTTTTTTTVAATSVDAIALRVMAGGPFRELDYDGSNLYTVLSSLRSE